MISIRAFSFIGVFICLVGVIPTQAQFAFEVLPGISGTAHTKLTIHQQGFDDIIIRANYEETSLTSPIYYSVRASYILNKKSRLELEMNHLKLNLINKPPEVQRFSISHGYNQFWAN